MRKPRIALVAHGIHDEGGMERAFAEVVRRLHTRYELVVFATDLAPELRHGVEWRRVPSPERPAPLRFACFYVIAAARLLRARATVVHTLGAIVPNTAHLATVQFCHAGFRDAARGLAPPDAPALRRLNTSLARLLCLVAERWSYRSQRVSVLAAVSSGIARELERHYPEIPTIVAPNGVDADRFRPDESARMAVREELEIRADEIVALFVGGDWDRKGLALAIEALGDARRTSGRQVSLLVVGRGDVDRFQRLARERGCDEHVRFVPPRRDVERYYTAADIFVFPTLYEAFPLVALEAAASALPIVATAVNGIEDLLAGDEAGILVEREPAEIAQALATLAGDDELRRALGAEARRRSQLYAWPRVVEPVEVIYRSVIGQEARAR